LKIGIYNEAAGAGIGGSESVAAILGASLAESHQVDLVHSNPDLSAALLAERSGVDLSRVHLRYVPADYDSTSYFRNPWKRYQASRDWNSNLSESYDVFVAIVHNMPPFCHAARGGALIVLFPFDTAAYIAPRGEMMHQSALRRMIENAYQRWEWKNRLATYQVKTAISDFSALWAQKRWGIECEVVSPPVDNCFRLVEKKKTIISVGRFAIEGEGHNKNQAEMLSCFKELEDSIPDEWMYFCVGGLRDTPAHVAYFDQLQNLAAGSRAQLVANIERVKLRSLYESASMFWHAAGYAKDEEQHPELAEHFGIVTVEAMAAGCVPIVINKGGQSEIVEHGVSGYLWDTLEQLKEYTRLLVNDDELRLRMSDAARQRAGLFSSEVFLQKFRGLLASLSGTEL
jgi:glycosyltransferase involved in cell wall biosynthesis